MCGEQEARRALDLYGDMVLRLCMVHLKNHADAEDVFQTVFLKYALCSLVFENGEHEKAWFIRVTVNACRDVQRRLFRSRAVPLEEAAELAGDSSEESRQVLEAVRSLPAKYRNVVYLHYYEGYTAPQIGQILGKNPNTVYTLLSRARALLRDMLGGDGDEG